MDVFYYWKDFDKDMRAGRIGYFASDRKKMADIRLDYPDYIWAFHTPKGRKGELELVACLKWADSAATSVPRLTAKAVIYYDPKHPDSRRFLDANTEERIAEISSMIRREFPKAFAANFQGDNGLQPMRGDFLLRFRKLVETFPSQPFLEAVPAEKPAAASQ